jgi:hypothetical protein
MWQRFGSEGREKSLRDTRWHLSYLSHALVASDDISQFHEELVRISQKQSKPVAKGAPAWAWRSLTGSW